MTTARRTEDVAAVNYVGSFSLKLFGAALRRGLLSRRDCITIWPGPPVGQHRGLSRQVHVAFVPSLLGKVRRVLLVRAHPR